MQSFKTIGTKPISCMQYVCKVCLFNKSRKENPQNLTQLSSRSHPRHLVGETTAQKDTIIDITSDSQVNSNFPYRWSPASLSFNNYFYLILYLYITCKRRATFISVLEVCKYMFVGWKCYCRPYLL